MRRYKDFDVGSRSITTLPISEDLAMFRSVVGGIRAEGGGDAPEDVAGGAHAGSRR